MSLKAGDVADGHDLALQVRATYRGFFIFGEDQGIIVTEV